MSDDIAHDRTLGRVLERLDALEAKNERLEQENRSLRADLRGFKQTKPAGTSPQRRLIVAGRGHGATGNNDIDGHVSRRGMLKLAGATALGAAGAVGVAGSPAGAANGDTVTAGNVTNAERRTALKYDGSSGFGGVVLLGNDSTYDGDSASYPAGLGGWAGAGATKGSGGVANGVYGFTDNGTGNGVVGVNTNLVAGAGNGVLGTANSTTGVGVKGSNTHGTAVYGSSDSTNGSATAITGILTSQMPGSFSSALRGQNNGTGGLGIGVWGSHAGSGWGMYATSASGFGLNASGGTGTGVNASGGTGVNASGNTIGVSASSFGGRGVVAAGNAAQLQLTPGSAAVHPTSGAVGDLYEDSTGTLWLCLGGTSWRKLGGPTTAGQLHVLSSPVRVYDSRTKDGPLAGGQERTVSLTTGTNATTPAVPAGAQAALFNLTIVNTGTNGFLAAFSNAVPYPNTSDINWFQVGTVDSTSVTSAVDSAAKVKLHCGGTPTDFVIDVKGYYQ